MDRKTNLEHFLIYYRDFAKKYPDFYMSRDYFYEQLRRYGIPNYDDSISYELVTNINSSFGGDSLMVMSL